jgi:hypothetical protein
MYFSTASRLLSSSSSMRLSSLSRSSMMSGVTKSGSTFFQKSGSLTSISACSLEDSPVNMDLLVRPAFLRLLSQDSVCAPPSVTSTCERCFSRSSMSCGHNQ